MCVCACEFVAYVRVCVNMGDWRELGAGWGVILWVGGYIVSVQASSKKPEMSQYTNQ